MNRRLRRRMVGLSAAALAAAVVLSACSSSGGSSSASSGSTVSGGSAGAAGGSASAKATGTPIKIGLICSCSGTFGGNESRAAKVGQAWAKSVNDSGGLDGHPVQLIVKDDGSNPGTSVTAVQSLISSHVAAILDSTVLDETWQKEIDAAKIPAVGGNFTVEPYYTDPNWYPTGQTNDSIVYANVATAKASGGSKLGLLYCSESVQCQQSVAPTKTVAKQLGVSLGYQAAISTTAPNYTAQCLAAKQAGVNSLIILDVTSAIIHVAQDCARQNYTPSFVAEGTGYANQVRTTSGLNNSYWAAFPILPYFAAKPQVSVMNRVLDKYEPGLREDDVNFSVVATQIWTAALAVQQAVTAARTSASSAVTAADITRGLNTFRNETLGGWSPPLTFEAGKPHPVDCWYTGRVHGGKASLVDGGKLTCQSSGSGS